MNQRKHQDKEPDWIFFGGTFDPPHIGHMDAVRFAGTRFPDAEIVVVPSFSPPVSKDISKVVEASFSDRIAMCVVAFDEWPQVQVSALEEDLDSPSYTVTTLRDLKAEYPLSRLAWMIGGDQLATFTLWLEPEKILEMASLVVVPRPAQAQIDLIETAARVATTLGHKVSLDHKAGVVLLDGGNSIFVLEDAPADVSSTELRSRLRRIPEGALDLIAPTVLDYISESGLYRD